MCCACFGILLFISAFPLILYNESRAVSTAAMLSEAREAVHFAVQDSVDRANEGKLVHVTADMKTSVMRDSALGVEADTVVLDRNVEMFQWEEEEETSREKDPRTGEEFEEKRTYYKETWSSSHINSRHFKDSYNYDNPSYWPLEELSQKAQPIVAGAYTFSPNLEDLVTANADLIVNNCKAPKGLDGYYSWSRDCSSRWCRCYPQGNMIYFSSRHSPQIGDIRVHYRYRRGKEVSILAKQKGNMLGTWTASNGKTLLLLEDEDVSADEMIDSAVSSNNLMTWGLRFLGWFFMFVGLQCAVSPILNLVSMFPLIGGFLSGLLSIGTTVAIFLLSLSLTLITVAMGWLVARPLTSVLLLAIGIAPIYLTRNQASKS